MSKKFNPLTVSAKYPNCGIPLMLDTYKTCSYNCLYCYSYNRVILGNKEIDNQPNFKWMKNLFKRIFDENNYNKSNFLHCLLKERITLHGGVQCECFQPIEKKLKRTQKAVEICNEYDLDILFTTKTDNLYSVPINPNNHSFSLSISNLHNDSLEPNVPSIDKRYEFFKKLKDEGYNVSIRLEPFIPTLTEWREIIDKFEDADHFHIECIRLTPQNKENVNMILKKINMDKSQFKQKGMLRLWEDYRLELYQQILDYFNEKGLSYSFNDSDMHHLSNNSCCCGDKLVKKTTTFNKPYLYHKYGINYNYSNLMDELGTMCDCNVRSLFASNRVGNLKTISEFYKDRWDSSKSPMSPKSTYKPELIQQNTLRKWINN